MRKTILLASLLIGMTGCTLLEQRQPSVAVPPPLQAARATPVQATDITSANAKAKLAQLQDELDRDAAANP